MTDVQSYTPSREDFAALLDESFGGRDFAEGTVVQGTVVSADRDFVVVDVGLKTEGRISLKEFGRSDSEKGVRWDTVEVYLERVGNAGRSGDQSERRPEARRPGPASRCVRRQQR